MGFRAEQVSMMDGHCENDPCEKDKYQDHNHEYKANGNPPGNEAESAGNAEISPDHCKHYAAPIAAARMSTASANCATLPAAPEPPPNSVCVIVGTIVMLRMNAIKTAITP